MKIALPIVAVALLAAAPAWSQDEPDAPAPPEESGEGVAEEEAAEGVASDEADAEVDGGPRVGLDEIPELDEQTHEKDDDDFVPSEQIPVDQSIPFPTDI